MSDTAVGVIAKQTYSCKAFENGIAECIICNIDYITEESLKGAPFNVCDMIDAIKNIIKQDCDLKPKYSRLVFITNTHELITNIPRAVRHLKCLIEDLEEYNDTVIIARVPNIHQAEPLSSIDMIKFEIDYEILLRCSFIDANALSNLEFSTPMVCITENAKELISEIIRMTY